MKRVFVEYKKTSFIVNPSDINAFFKDFEHKSLFNLKNSLKKSIKEYGFIDDINFYAWLGAEIQVECRPGDYYYRSNKSFKIAFIKLRTNDEKTNKGKSKGWRVIGLMKKTNSILLE